jgi:hypothetical protein
MKPRILVPILAVAALCPVAARADVLGNLLACQKAIARAGARFAFITVQKTLDCTNELVECQVKCEEGVFGPSCDESPPPCCDPEDRESNPLFGACMTAADGICAQNDLKIAVAEATKRARITGACEKLTEEQLCGSDTAGLNFDTLAAGCAALIPGWECDLDGILDCVGGPLEQSLAEEIGGLLDPRAGSALQTAGVAGFDGIARTVKVNETLPAGRTDVWAIEGVADEEIRVAVKTRRDTAGGTSTLDPVLTYLGADAATPVADTNITTFACPHPNACGSQCPTFKRRFPFTGTFYAAVRASTSGGCAGGGYRLIVTTKGGATPTLVADDIDPP